MIRHFLFGKRVIAGSAMVLLALLFITTGIYQVSAFQAKSGSFLLVTGPGTEDITGPASSTTFKEQNAGSELAIGISSSTAFKPCIGSLCFLFTTGSNPAYVPFISGYRWYSNANATSTGATLAAVNATTTAPAQGTAFRLRATVFAPAKPLDPTDANVDILKLQVAVRSGTCDTAFSGEVYADVATSSGAIRFSDNAAGTDGDRITASSSDPAPDPIIIAETYEEANNFSVTSTVAIGADGLWDFVLVDNSAPSATTYCFRVVNTANASTAPMQIPEITTVTAASGITVSGTVYADEGVTTATSALKLVVNGTTAYTSSTAANGTYTFTSVTQPSAGDVLTVWMDNNGGGNGLGATVTRATSTGNISGLDIYKQRLITRHEDNGPLTGINIGQCDKGGGAVCIDSDLHFDASTSTGALTVDNDWALYLWGGKTFTPGGAVTLAVGGASSTPGGDIKWASSTSALSMGANNLSVGGDWNNAIAGTATVTGATTTFTATSTGFIINSGNQNFGNLTFNGAAGGWSASTSAITATGTLTLTNGTVDMLSNALTVQTDLTTAAGTTFQGTGNVTVNGNVTLNGTVSYPLGTFTQIVSADKSFAVGASSVNLNSITFDTSGGTARTITGTTSGGTVVASSSVIIGNTGTVSTTLTTTAPFDINGSLTVSSTGVLVASSTTQFNVAQNFTQNGVFTSASSTFIFDTTATSSITGTASTPATFWNLTLTTSGGNKAVQFKNGKTFGTNGLFKIESPTKHSIVLTSDSAASQWNINHQGTESISYADIKDSGCNGASTNISVSAANTNSGNNGTCWLFQTLGLTISPTSINLGLTVANSKTVTSSNTLTVTSTVELGYNVTAYETQTLKRGASGPTIADWAGTNAVPTNWTTTCIASSTQCGFGYSTNDADLAQFSSTKYAGFITTSPGDIVATKTVSANGDATAITYRSSVSDTQVAGQYTNSIIFILTQTF